MPDFVKKSDLDFALQLKNFSNKLATHQVILGLTATDVTDATIASDYFKFVLDMQTIHAERTKNWTSYKDLLRKPGAGVPPSSSAPATLTMPTAPTAAPLGIEVWFRAIVKRIKGSKNYTENIGNDLGILAISSSVDTSNIQPKLTVQLSAGQPLIIWKKNGMDGIEIYKDKGDGNWFQLIFDQRPNHLDNSELPPVGTSATWKYKAIYRYQDQRVGLWSDEVNVAVQGNV